MTTSTLEAGNEQDVSSETGSTEMTEASLHGCILVTAGESAFATGALSAIPIIAAQHRAHSDGRFQPTFRRTATGVGPIHRDGVNPYARVTTFAPMAALDWRADWGRT